MKKTVDFFLISLFLCCRAFAWNGSVDTAYAGGDGTKGKPYQIASASQLALLAKQVNEDHMTHNGHYFVLTADIDLWGTKDGDTIQWVPIGLTALNEIHTGGDAHPDHHPFQGTFDGQGYTIKNLYINNKEQMYAGLFGHVSMCTLKNIIIENAYVNVKTFASALCARSSYNTIIDNCHVKSGDIIVEGAYVGGIVGYIKSYRLNDFSHYDYDQYYYFYNSSVTRCTNRANITGRGLDDINYEATGGIVGAARGSSGSPWYPGNHWNSNDARSHTMTIKQCTNYGTVTGGHVIGGVCGSFSDDGMNKDAFTYRGGDIVIMDSCSNYGTIIIFSPSHRHPDLGFLGTAEEGPAGGVIGFSGASGIIQHCMNAGDFLIEEDYSATSYNKAWGFGGIVGWGFFCTVQYCVNIGNCHGYVHFFGGICGITEGSVNACLNAGLNQYDGNCFEIGGIVCRLYKGRQSITNCLNVNIDNVDNSLRSAIVNDIYYSSFPPPLNLYQTKVSNCYFDFQCHSYDRTKYSDNTDYGQRITSRLLGNGLKGEFSENDWVFSEGMYPRPKGVETSDIAIIAATPILLNVRGDDDFDMTNSVNCDFMLGGADSISWSSDAPLSIEGSHVSIVDSLPQGQKYRLYAKYGLASRLFAFKVKSYSTVDTVRVTTDKPYVFNGKKYSKSGIYKEVFVSAGGCDSIVVLVLRMLIKPEAEFQHDVSFCQNENQMIHPFKLTSGQSQQAIVKFDPQAVLMGFSDGTYPVQNNRVLVPMPLQVKAGKGQCTVILQDVSDNLESEPYTVQFTILLDGYVHQKFGTVLLVDNNPNNGKPAGTEDLSFNTFQWYKNGTPIPGGNEPFIYERGGLDGIYEVALTTTNGQNICSCPVEVHAKGHLSLLRSNMVERGDNLILQDNLQGLCRIYTLLGVLVSEEHSDLTPLAAPDIPGMYIFCFIDEASGQQYVEKFIVK